MDGRRELQEHAAQCGIDMADKVAVSVDDLLAGSQGFIAHAVQHPEDRRTLLAVGMWVDVHDVQFLLNAGIDYVIIEN